MSETERVLEHLKLIGKDISILSAGLSNATIIKDMGVMVDASELRNVLKHMTTSVWACRDLLDTISQHYAEHAAILEAEIGILRKETEQ